MSRWYRHIIRVRYQETDQMGVVYHANYLNWFEIGRTEMIRTLGIPYQSLEAQGLLLPLIEADMKFKLPAKYDDLVGIYTRVTAFTGLKLEFESQIRKLEPAGEPSGMEPKASQPTEQPEGELLVSGSTRHVWLNKGWKPVRIDREAPELFALLQANEREEDHV